MVKNGRHSEVFTFSSIGGNQKFKQTRDKESLDIDITDPNYHPRPMFRYCKYSF